MSRSTRGRTVTAAVLRDGRFRVDACGRRGSGWDGPPFPFARPILRLAESGGQTDGKREPPREIASAIRPIRNPSWHPAGPLAKVAAAPPREAFQADVAQLVEQLTRNEQVVRSNRIVGSIRLSRPSRFEEPPERRHRSRGAPATRGSLGAEAKEASRHQPPAVASPFPGSPPRRFTSPRLDGTR